MDRNQNRRDGQNRDYGRNDHRQNEQFANRSYSHGDDSRSWGQMGESSREDYGQGSPGYGNNPERGSSDYGRSNDRYADTSQGGYSSGGFGPSSYTSGDGRNFGSFNSNDFGGGDFSGPARNMAPGSNYTPNGAYGASYGAGSYGAAPARDRYDTGQPSWGNRGNQGQGSRDDRGFFERAGDQVASWFGDEDAARRRENDHTGAGPANYTRSDERILEDACDNITRDPGVDGRQIQVTVDKGEVTLDGTVTSRQQKRQAEDVVDAISGVRHVQNNLRVKERDRNGSDMTGSSAYNRDTTSGTSA